MSAFDWVLLILTHFSQQCFPTEQKGGKSGPTLNGTYGCLGEVKWSEVKWSEVKVISGLVFNICRVPILGTSCSTSSPLYCFFLCTRLLNVIDILCIGLLFWSVFLIAPILQTLQYTLVENRRTKSEPKLQPTHFNIIFYDLLKWCYHLLLGLKTVLFRSCFQTKLFNLFSQPPHFSLFLFNPQKITLGIWT